ncbi:hypothetical protein ACFWNC_09015 [Streptomyces sp. NPDC058369]|uniref:hypothetical protein n=1 Tax=Streptomyces sp. NPDC058369 TaxID=3346462 RepID=UPI003663315F
MDIWGAPGGRAAAGPGGLHDADREVLTGLLGRLVLENKVPMVFRESCENAPAATPGC